MAFELNDFDWQKLNWQNFGKAIRKGMLFKYRILPFIILLVGMITSFLIGKAISDCLGLRNGASIIPIYAGFAVSLGVFIFILRRNSQTFATVHFASNFREGPIEFVIDEEGVKYSSRYNSSVTLWPCFMEVLDYKDGLILRLGQHEGMPIPDQFLPPDMTREMAKAQILEYMARTRVD